MTGAAPPADPQQPADDAALAAALVAIDPRGTGASLRAPPGPARDRWLTLLRGGLPPDAPVRRLPASAPDGRLLGGLDLAATLAAGRPVADRGLLAEADGGVVLVAMAERLPPASAARVAAVLDDGAVAAERDGLSLRHPARIGLVALDEGLEPEERPAAALLDRLAFHLALDAQPCPCAAATPSEIAAARARLPEVGAADEAVLRALCETAMALGIDSPRAPLLALRAARASAALAGRLAPSEADAVVAARLVLAPRATRLPAPDQPEAAEPREPDPDAGRNEDDRTEPGPDSMRDMLVAAAAAALPAGLLAGLAAATRKASCAAASQGRAGAPRQAARRGRRIGALPGDPRSGGRLDLVETLRAAAPWQRSRRRQSAPGTPRVAIRREDFRLVRFRQETGTTTIFVVDASGSTAVNRLGEAKGAVELLLADCYARRDQVALLAFRGTGAELLLPPTSSLVRAKRSLAALPGGGGTPLAAGLDAALEAAQAERRRGRTPTVVLLTDGRANVARDGTAGGDRARAEGDALAAARLARGAAVSAVLVDTAPRPRAFTRQLAAELGARYLPLPAGSGTADALAGAVKNRAAP